MPNDLFGHNENSAEVAAVVDEARNDVRYVVTDFPIEFIVNKFRDEAEQEGDIYVPDYQRTLRWDDQQASYFIESLLIRIPVPPVFLYDVGGRLEIVDGSQRIRSLVKFFNGDFRLRGLEKVDILNGYAFDELPIEVQRRLRNTPIRSFVLDESTDANLSVELFRRLNTSGQRLRDAEIRKGAFSGPFLDLVIECSELEVFTNLTHNIKKRGAKSERQELVARFFVYSDAYVDFRHDVRDFLDKKMIEYNASLKKPDLTKMKREFERTLAFITQHMPKAFYRNMSGSVVPRVRFEAISVGVNLALRENPDVNYPGDGWLYSDEFRELVRTDGSNSGPKLRARIEFVRDKLLDG